MSITDELRKWNTGRLRPDHAAALDAIADRIDEAHKHAIGYVDDRDPEMMAENGWVKLPVDADGVPIRVGDEMVDWDTPRLVVAVSENSICLAGYESGSYYRMGIANNYRHYHEPTVEDVLREFALTCEDAGNAGPEVERIIAEYASKLRLAEKESHAGA